jgi:uncharacterized repeat protein (TIGR03803 family)
MRTIFLPIILFAFATTGCGHSPMMSSLPRNETKATAAQAPSSGSPYQVLYSFGGAPDGAMPVAGLLAVNGVMYGTTYGGGVVSGCSSGFGTGCGTVFEVPLSGTESVIHVFGGSGDGANPAAGLIARNGIFYGTTENGGASGNGAVFDVNASGAEQVLYSFSGAPDGAQPEAGLINVKGALYGTTYGGGNLACIDSPSGCGTAFRVSASGKESIVHRFGIRPDGSFPKAGLVFVRGEFYGTTLKRSTNEGGATCGTGDGCGVVFQMNASGQESVFYRFLKKPDGSGPTAELTARRGNFYGTTSEGGTGGNGTVFEVNGLGVEQVLHSFNGSGDGANPFGGLVYANGLLYGTTYNGGQYGKGTLFKISASGATSVLHAFGAGTDGANPRGSLIVYNGTLYGTTEFGGANNDGTVFSQLP